MAQAGQKARGLRGAATAGLCALALAQGTAATAGALRILPVRVEVAPKKQFCSLQLSNDGAATATVQVRGYGWTKDGEGGDILDPVSGPTVNPAIVSIPPGETRLIRCSLSALPGPAEQSYRLILDELPTANSAPGTVQTLLRISIPVFRAPAGAAPALGWSTRRDPQGATRLALANRGNRHAQATAIILKPAAGGGAPVRITRGFYLLAGGRIELPLPSLPRGGIAAVELETTQGRLSASPATPGQSGG